MEPLAITRSLTVPGPFWTFNREERNAVSILVSLLGQASNLETFVRALGWAPPDLADAEVSVEWTFLRDLWSHHSQRQTPHTLRLAILDCLQPLDRARLEACSIHEFNTHFGAVPQPSTTYVQSPGNWSIGRFDRNIPENDQFRQTCRFKWAFNIKPDLVIQTPSGHVLCIEAKWDSMEGKYPASEPEKVIFKRRGLPYLTQTEVQRYLVNEALGLQGTFAYLARSHFETDAGRSVTWAEIIPQLDRSDAPKFVQAWCEQEAGRS